MMNGNQKITNIDVEKELIRQCLQGEKAAWDEFVEKYSKLVYNAIYRALELNSYSINSELVEDLYQEFFLSILKDDFHKLRKFTWKNGCSMATWLSVIARNMVFDFIRKDVKHKEKFDSLDKKLSEENGDASLGDIIGQNENPPHKTLINEENSEMLQKAIEKLSSDDKMLLEMLYYQGLPIDEIARILNKSRDALYMQKMRLIERLGEIVKNLC